jgi:hypothetical protein
MGLLRPRRCGVSPCVANPDAVVEPLRRTAKWIHGLVTSRRLDDETGTGIDYGFKCFGQTSFRCGCAEDLESNQFWRVVGFEQIGKRNGVIPFTRKPSKRIINLYRFRLKVPSFIPYTVSQTTQQTPAVIESSFQL